MQYLIIVRLRLTMVSYNVWRLVAASGGVISIYCSSSCKSENFEVTLLGGKKSLIVGKGKKNRQALHRLIKSSELIVMALIRHM